MTATGAKTTGAGASSCTAQRWDQANWSYLKAEVKRLQVRIAKATREDQRPPAEMASSWIYR
jgi:RNA-directed DNA polymerase